MHTSDKPLKMLEHARGHGNTATLEPIMEVGYSVTIVAVSPQQMRSTYGHTESLPIVAVQFVRSLLQRRVDDQLVTSPVVAPLLRRAADGMTVHTVRQTWNDRQRQGEATVRQRWTRSGYQPPTLSNNQALQMHGFGGWGNPSESENGI